jgi:N-dimethylarginine dimethylaminohydrolase
MSSAHILMCPPDYYGIEYEINPWMNRRRQCDAAEAAAQWRGLRQILEAAGARVSCVVPVPGLPDLVFTANAGLVYRDEVVLAQFRHVERRAEEPRDETAFAEHGFRVRRLPAGMSFEGAGDALFCGPTLFAGYRIRSDILAHQAVAALLGCEVIPLELVAPHFYHLDTCFCPVAPGVAIYYPPAFDEYGQRVLVELIPDLIAVGEEEARRMACNAVVVGRKVVTNSGCPELHAALRARGFETFETPLGEFIKAGGSAKCLTLRLDGEDAAGWRDEARAACVSSAVG